MTKRILNARATSFVLLLLIMSLFAGTKGWQVEAKAQAETGRVMFLIPSDPQAIEEKFNPDKLVELGVVDLGVTTEWQKVSEVAASGQLKGLIIHHAAFDKVNIEELRSWFHNDKLVVTGLGIQGTPLAEAIGMPELGNSLLGYTSTIEFFYTYWYAIEGSPEDVALYDGDSGASDFQPKGIVKGHLIRSGGAATDYLSEDADAKRMLVTTKEKIQEQEEFVIVAE